MSAFDAILYVSWMIVKDEENKSSSLFVWKNVIILFLAFFALSSVSIPFAYGNLITHFFLVFAWKNS